MFLGDLPGSFDRDPGLFEGEYDVQFLRAAQLKLEDIGGGVVRRAFRSGSRFVKANTQLSAEEIMSWPSANRAALIDKGWVAVWPRSGDAPASGRRFVIHLGAGRYDVIEGRRVNDEVLTREEARALAEDKSH